MPLIKKEIPSIKLKIVGRDLIDKNGKSYIAYLKSYIDSDLEENVQIIGSVPHSEVAKYIEQDAGPGLVLIEGGTFVMGATQDPTIFTKNNTPVRITVRSFYMDQTEISNNEYRQFVHWVRDSIAREKLYRRSYDI